MNRKFIRENKKQLREFLGSIISSIVASSLTKNIDTKKYPELMKKKSELIKISKELDDKLKDIKKTNPKLYKSIQSRRIKF